MNAGSSLHTTTDRDPGWYDLFSRGARDWLRHNEKIRDAVREQLTQLIPQANIDDADGHQRVKVPVKFLEHYRFKLNDKDQQDGAGQGAAKPDDILRRAQQPDKNGEKGAGGNEGGGVEFVLELAIDDIVDWLWEELELPDLIQKSGEMEDEEYEREGWNKRGVRSRLDRRRSMKESIKRRSIQKDSPAIIDDDLRFRQLVQRRKPSCDAVVYFVMDVSASMLERDRQLAKTFFFWVVQGLRRQYVTLDCEFIAHTDRAWRFSESEFFQVKGSGGTVASHAFELVEESIASEYDPGRYNIYVFYASDGDNFGTDQLAANDSLRRIMQVANFAGLVQTSRRAEGAKDSEMANIFADLEKDNLPTSSYFLDQEEQVWEAIKAFFQRSSEPQER